MSWNELGKASQIGGITGVKIVNGCWLSRFSTGDPRIGSGLARWEPGAEQVYWRRVFEEENLFGDRSICAINDLTVCVRSEIGNSGDEMLAFQPTNGNLEWSTELNLKVGGGAPLGRGLATVDEGLLVYGLTPRDFEAHVLAVDTSSGEILERHKAPTGDEFFHQAGQFFVSDSASGAHVINPKDGSDWRHFIDREIAAMVEKPEYLVWLCFDNNECAYLQWCDVDSLKSYRTMQLGRRSRELTCISLAAPTVVALYDLTEFTVEVIDIEKEEKLWATEGDPGRKYRDVIEFPQGVAVLSKARNEPAVIETYEVRSGELIDRYEGVHNGTRALFWEQDYLFASWRSGTHTLAWENELSAKG